MKILKIVLTAIMTACLCVGGICSFAFASDDTSVQTDSAEIALPDYKGTTYDVTMGTYGDQPIAFGTTESVTTDTVYLQYTVVSYSFRGNGFGGLVRGNGATLWFNTAGTTYANYADGHSYADLFVVDATYTIKYYNIGTDVYSFAIYKSVDGNVEDITGYLTDTPTFNDNSNNLGVFGMGILNDSGTIEFTDFAIFDGNLKDLGVAKYAEHPGTVTVTAKNPQPEQPEPTPDPVEFDEVEYTGGTYTVTNTGFFQPLYFGSGTAVATDVGTKVFLEYEVESASTGATQWGMVETSTPSTTWAINGGAMKYAGGKVCQLLDAGAKYKYEWSVTESGLKVMGEKTATDGAKTDLVALMDNETATLTANTHYGLWLSEGNTDAFKLVNVKCYDGEGRELGILSNNGAVLAVKDGVTEDVTFDEVEYKSVLTYDITLSGDPIFFGNKRAISTEVGSKMFIEYTVADAGSAISAQYGFVATGEPTYLYPFADGRGTLAFKNEATQFDMAGATYKFEFVVTETGVDVKGLRVSADGVKTDLVKDFDLTPLVKNGYYGLWQSAGAVWGAKLTDCKCYDGEGNDLGFVTQQPALTIKEHEYGINYVVNGESVNDKMTVTSFTYSAGLSAIEACDLQNGTHVEGWYSDEGLTTPVTSIEAGRTEGITLYGKVVNNDYRIIFDGNGASGEMAKQSVKYGEKVTLNANAFDYGNFEFLGWMLGADGTEVVYEDGAEVMNLVNTQNGTITLYALWKMQIWNINYVMPEGAINSENNPATYNENSHFDLGEATLTNYVFKGWYKDEAYTQKIETVDCDTMSGELTLYAKFVKFTLDIPSVDYKGFVKYGVETSFSSAYLTNSEPMTLKHGEKFFMEYHVDSSTDGSNQWGIIATASHDATYPYTGGAGVMIFANDIANDTFIAGTTVKLYVEVLDTGYIKFVLGYVDAEGFEHDVTDKLTNIVADGYEGASALTLDTIPANYHYGLWNAGNHVISSLSDFVVYNENGENLKPMVNKCGYGSATFTEPTYNVTYIVNGEPLQGLTDNWTKFTYSEGLSSLPVYSEEGKHIVGWYTDETYTTAVTKIDAGISHDVTLYCKLGVNKYNVKFEGNGADNSMDAQVITYGETVRLSRNVLTRAGYTFAGWATSENGEVVYADEAEVINLSKKNNANVKLYAVWTKATYTVSYEADGGENPNTATTYDIDNPVTLQDATKSGYTFDGWYTSSDFAEGTKVTVLDKQGNVTLYAKFTKNKSGCKGTVLGCTLTAILTAGAGAVVLKRRNKKDEK